MTLNVESFFDQTVRLTPPAAVAVANKISDNVPIIINWVTLFYVSVLLTHKLWTIFKDWREGRLRIRPVAVEKRHKTDRTSE
jgi:hypothetical protein